MTLYSIGFLQSTFICGNQLAQSHEWLKLENEPTIVLYSHTVEMLQPKVWRPLIIPVNRRNVFWDINFRHKVMTFQTLKNYYYYYNSINLTCKLSLWRVPVCCDAICCALFFLLPSCPSCSLACLVFYVSILFVALTYFNVCFRILLSPSKSLILIFPQPTSFLSSFLGSL